MITYNDKLPKALYIGSTKTPFMKELGLKLSSNYEVKLFDVLNYSHKNKIEKIIYKIPRLRVFYNLMKLSLVILFLDRNDIIHIHGCRKVNLFLYPFIRIKMKNIYTTIWGSDYLKADKIQLSNIKRYFSISKKITFTNQSLLKMVAKAFPEYEKKMLTLNYGFSIVDLIKGLKIGLNKEELKKDFGIYKDKITICCGTNSSSNQQLELIISALNKFDKIDFVALFPMTYGDLTYREKIKDLLKTANFEYIILEKFLSNQDLAKLRLVSDFLIQIQKTDQFSGAMLETLFAENYVITGSWLPYDVLRANGVKMIEIGDESELLSTLNNLETVCKNIDKRQNADFIWSITSWESVLLGWNRLYQGD